MDGWKGNSLIFKGYCKGEGKKPIGDLKKLLPWDKVSGYKSFGGLLNKGFIDISFDTEERSKKFLKMMEDNEWKCMVVENPSNKHIHSYWRIPDNWNDKNGVDKKLSCGLIADIHNKGTYIPLKVDGVERKPIIEPDDVEEVPEELYPVDTKIELLKLKEGEGRNEELFRYILVLQNKAFDKEVVKRILHNTNKFVFDDPLPERELDNILRDGAFDKPIFFNDKTFLHDVFGRYLISEYHIKRIDGQLHIYDKGIYKPGYRLIENKMVEVVPGLKAASRKEVLTFLEIYIPENTVIPETEANYIAFKNGVLDISSGELLPFDPNHIITNMIPWNYDKSAYSEDCDKMLNRISCNDKAIRMLLEECVGYCFFRNNKLQKAFILTGEKSNGKSTFIKTLNRLLGDENISAIDLKNLGDRFNKATLYKKLANIDNDISDEFVSDPSLFKKIVSGDKITGEYKGQAIFEFNPYAKLIFGANTLPRIKDRTFAVQRRLVVIPFKATFSADSEGYDSNIQSKLDTRESIEYMIKLGVEGLKRILKNQGFTSSEEVNKELEAYKEYNNPVIAFLKEIPEDEILNHSIKDVFIKYELFCRGSGFIPYSRPEFTKAINRELNCRAEPRKVEGKSTRVFFK